MRNGCVSARRTSEHRTFGTDGGSSRAWPTPTTDAATERPGRYEQGGLSLSVAVRESLFPTPRADKTTEESLESWQARNAAGKVSTPPLALAVRMSRAKKGEEGTSLLPSPAARDWRSGKGRKENGHTPQLPEVIEATSGDGQALNPDWVEVLMGWPVGWTRADEATGPASGND